LRNISDTIARLAALRAQHATRAPDGGPSGRLSTLDGFGANPGGLTARYHVPDDLPEGAPLVVVLHGCTQSAAAYDDSAGWSRLAEEAGFAVLYPEQQSANNPNLCFNWFQPGDIGRDRGEALSIRGMVDALVAAHGLDRGRVFITGLSAGGAMAGVMLATHPEVFAAGAIIAGLPYGTATTVPQAFDRMRGAGLPADGDLHRLVREASAHEGPWPRVSIWHGAADQTVAPANAAAIATQWRAAHGLAAVPSHDDRAGGRRTRQAWHDAEGRPAVEVHLIAGMGHGTPLDGGDLGRPAPFMLDVGISSTREIAGFFGIVGGRAATARDAPPATVGPTAPSAPPAARPVVAAPPPARPTGEASPEAHGPQPAGVRKIIEDALRAAGLMR
jgi:poly(hydroxyalkanoate) depolymerase family esterase